MKIVFSNKALNNPGGTERVTAILSKELAERGHEVHIVSFVGSDKETFFPIDKRVKIHFQKHFVLTKFFYKHFI